MEKDKYNISPCECCGKPSQPIHHKYSKTFGKHGTAKMYRDYIDHPDNKQYVCISCNSSHQGQGKGLIVWSEQEFCKRMGIEPRSKSSQKVRKIAE